MTHRCTMDGRRARRWAEGLLDSLHALLAEGRRAALAKARVTAEQVVVASAAGGRTRGRGHCRRGDLAQARVTAEQVVAASAAGRRARGRGPEVCSSRPLRPHGRAVRVGGQWRSQLRLHESGRIGAHPGAPGRGGRMCRPSVAAESPRACGRSPHRTGLLHVESGAVAATLHAARRASK